MKIPKRFKLFGQTIAVKFDPLLVNENDNLGQAVYRRSEIRLQPNTAAHPRNPDQIGQTFCHELMHHMLYAANAKKGDEWLHKDEVLVDVLGSLLHQALTTMEYK